MGTAGNIVPFQITKAVYNEAVNGTPASVDITWQSREDAEYTIETSTDLQEFEELTDGFPSEGDGTTTFNHEGAEGPERYYRVKEDG